jgi:hypothetical protein
MQDHQLTIHHMLDRMRRVYGDREVVTLKVSRGRDGALVYATSASASKVEQCARGARHPAW